VHPKQPGAQAIRTVDLSLIFADELGQAPQPTPKLKMGNSLGHAETGSHMAARAARAPAACS
jgi:hypothetical protein